MKVLWGDIMKNAKVIYILAMLIFGSIGLFVRNIGLSSTQVALVRGVIGCVFLLAASLLLKQRLSRKAIRKNLLPLILSGIGIGFNWILLFQAYKYTTIANATLSYYFAPVFILFLSPLILKERLTVIKVGCILAAVAGMFCIVGSSGGTGAGDIIGIGYGLLAAILYAAVVITNKFFKGLSGLETTLVQLCAAALVLVPYTLLTEEVRIFSLDTKSTVLLLIVGIIHTGFAYLMYFTAIRHLNGQTIAVFSYIDPISAVILSSLLFQEPMTLLQILGGILILGATLICELSGRDKRAEKEGDMNEG